jgi:hypothetical protein
MILHAMATQLAQESGGDRGFEGGNKNRSRVTYRFYKREGNTMKRVFQGIALFILTMVFLASAVFLIAAQDTVSADTMKEVTLLKAEKIKLDTFFSNFAEIPIDKFGENALKDEMLLNFGIHHNWINNRKLFKIDGGSATISEKYVSDSIVKYFGKDVNAPHSIRSKFGYKAGSYRIPCADGETFRFAQLDRMYSMGNDIYLCHVNTCHASSGFAGDVHKSIAELNKDKDDANHVSADEKIVAKIKKVTQSGTTRYVLLSYEKEK